MAQLYALTAQLKQAREQSPSIQPPPIASLQIPVPAATPESKKTFQLCQDFSNDPSLEHNATT
jgi:hypothetical protein